MFIVVWHKGLRLLFNPTEGVCWFLLIVQITIIKKSTKLTKHAWQACDTSNDSDGGNAMHSVTPVSAPRLVSLANVLNWRCWWWWNITKCLASWRKVWLWGSTCCEGLFLWRKTLTRTLCDEKSLQLSLGEEVFSQDYLGTFPLLTCFTYLAQELFSQRISILGIRSSINFFQYIQEEY